MSKSAAISRRAKDLFGDCALVEIIHLHDCFRGALRALELDVAELCREIIAVAGDDNAPMEQGSSNDYFSPDTVRGSLDTGIQREEGDADGMIANNNNTAAAAANLENHIINLERRVAGRFTVIWSVFRAHSAAEDEFIWPALKAKQVDLPNSSSFPSPQQNSNIEEPEVQGVVLQPHRDDNDQHLQRDRAHSLTVHCIEQEEYEEDHADEERMFNSINDILSKLRDELSNRHQLWDDEKLPRIDRLSMGNESSLRQAAQMLLEGTENLMRHLLTHLEKEETHCMPLVAQYLTKAEIHDLVGKIMGKRSSELMSQILTMAVQNLNQTDRDDMVRYMKQAMVGTFFERWLKMGGLIPSPDGGDSGDGGGKMQQKLQQNKNVNPNEDGSCGGKAQRNPEQDRITGLSDPLIGNAQSSEFKTEPTCAKCLSNVGTQMDTVTVVAAEAATGTAMAATPATSKIESSKLKENQQSPRAISAPYLSEPFASKPASSDSNEGVTKKYTSAGELEKLIRAIGTNPNLDTKQKNVTIQGLRDSVWKSNCRLSKRKREEEKDSIMVNDPVPQTSHAVGSGSGSSIAAVATSIAPFSTGVGPAAASLSHATLGGLTYQTHHMSISGALMPATPGTRWKRETPPSSYFKKTATGEVKLVWSSDPRSTKFHPDDSSVPLFSASELAPTYHDGGINHVLGCPHYARSCKLRHPSSGRLYTCRLCCEQQREMATGDKDSPLDRYAVTEILCMRCGALQPSGNKCINPECESRGKPFARYTCKICNFYDNSSNKSIYHCPFCNVCRTGLGLGIDYRHCMRCNACVSLKDDHNCIPQRLQGNCPICHETMFESTEPLRGLKCGHVMHLSCFTMYMRLANYTCPLCKKSAEDMKDYFALLDSAIRMQPMPPAYATTTSNIYCQDCGKMGNVSYHFVGLKCCHCGSYNTRELQRIDANIMASLWQGY